MSIKVFINGERREVPKIFNLEELVEHFSMPSKCVAIELNRIVIRRNDWGTTTVRNDDAVEIIHFVGGG